MIFVFSLMKRKVPSDVCVHSEDLWVCLKLLSLSLNLAFVYFLIYCCRGLSHLLYVYLYVIHVCVIMKLSDGQELFELGMNFRLGIDL